MIASDLSEMWVKIKGQDHTTTKHGVVIGIIIVYVLCKYVKHCAFLTAIHFVGQLIIMDHSIFEYVKSRITVVYGKQNIYLCFFLFSSLFLKHGSTL